ncbi:MAG: nucleotidyltransferase family protein [Cyanobacteria bacterium RUI128]|nr:nucleotidyltransferase family protein [Cyanobacteria bacterium RUI128]
MNPIMFSLIPTDVVQVNNNKRIAFKANSSHVRADRIEKIGEASPTEKSTRMLLSMLKSSLSGGEVNMAPFKGANYFDWAKLLEIANEASVTAVALESSSKLPKGTIPADIMGKMFEIQQETEAKHAHQEKILGELSERFAKRGIETVQLKGVGFSMNYPHPNHRFGGDIDLFTRIKGTVTENRSNSSDIIDNMMLAEGREIDDYNLPKVKHSEFEYDGVRIENHRYFVNKERLCEAKQIDVFLHKSLNPRAQILPKGTKILVPSAEFNTVFMAQHAFQHFIFGGIDLHHLTDWAMHIKENGLNFPNELKGTRLEQFTYAFTNLANNCLGTKVKAPENKEYEDKLLKTLLNPEAETAPAGLNNVELLAFKAKRLIRKAKHAREYGGRNVTRVFVETAMNKIKDPSKLLRR